MDYNNHGLGLMGNHVKKNAQRTLPPGLCGNEFTKINMIHVKNNITRV